MKIILKRAYEISREDRGTRILVDKFWPRGIKRETLQVDYWARDLAPSDTLRKWYHNNRNQWEAFREKYHAELLQNKEALEQLRSNIRDKAPLMLLYSSKEEKYNNAAVLKQFLETQTVRARKEVEKTFTFMIREAKPHDFGRLSSLMVTEYGHLAGFPGRDVMPDYYEMLDAIGKQDIPPGTKLIAAVSETDELLGGVVFIDDMKHYGSGGTAKYVANAAGFRLLVVASSARGLGIGKALAEECVQRARNKGRSQVVIHTTESMKVAWKMYERMGFQHSLDLDFFQHSLYVYGFRLSI